MDIKLPSLLISWSIAHLKAEFMHYGNNMSKCLAYIEISRKITCLCPKTNQNPFQKPLTRVEPKIYKNPKRISQNPQKFWENKTYIKKGVACMKFGIQKT